MAEAVQPPSQEPVRTLLGAAKNMEFTGGRADASTSDTDLSQLLARIVPAEVALERAALIMIGAARGRDWPWSRIGTALGLSAESAQRRFDDSCARHPDYIAPPAPTLDAHITHAGVLLAAITDPPGPLTADAATRLLGAILLTATLEQNPGLAGHWLTEPDLTTVTKVAAAHPRSGASTPLEAFAEERPGIRTALLGLLREALLDTPWAPSSASTAPTDPTPPMESTVVSVPRGPHTPVEHLLELAEVIQRRLPDLTPGKITDALRGLATAIDTGAPALLDDPIQTVAALEGTERARALGPEGEVLWHQVRRSWFGALLQDLTHLVTTADLPADLAGPLLELHTAAAPHLRSPATPEHTALLNALAALGQAITDADPRGLATAVSRLAATERDRTGGRALAGIANPLGRVQVALETHTRTSADHAFDTRRTALDEEPSDWSLLAAEVLPANPSLAAATAALLEVAMPLVGKGVLGRAATYNALHHLDRAVVTQNRATIDAALDRVVALKPGLHPLSRHPQVADALRALAKVYVGTDKSR
ncbi:hypothetical protein [Nocardiopsis sp. CNS-639]|uniref:hypothetical protein n=1 Tax=Nocardiopsis sp. CNS-639 TaxID=1169153 RepID=UPI0003A117B0|nr:hypothetical protein [Nocardiopsis sp. CNS-639]